MTRAEGTRLHIIESAIHLFNTKGYQATSLSDITKATGMTKGAIYGNFVNKDELAVASFEHASSIVISRLRERIRKAPDAPSKLKAILLYHQDYLDKPPFAGGCPIINTSVEADDDHPLLRKKTEAVIRMIKDSLIKIINRGIAEGQISHTVNAELFATTFYATITGAIIIARTEENGKKSYELIRDGLIATIQSISITNS